MKVKHQFSLQKSTQIYVNKDTTRHQFNYIPADQPTIRIRLWMHVTLQMSHV